MKMVKLAEMYSIASVVKMPHIRLTLPAVPFGIPSNCGMSVKHANMSVLYRLNSGRLATNPKASVRIRGMRLLQQRELIRGYF